MAGLSVSPGHETGTGRVLTAEQRQQYWRDGYVLLRKVVPQERLDKYRSRFRELCDGKAAIPMLTMMKDVTVRDQNGERAVNKIQDFQHDNVLFDYCKYPGVVAPVQDLIGENVLAMHTMLINKPPDPGTKTSRHPLHQDLHYFPFRPADRIVCSWTAMERVHRENGCLVLLPGSHRDGVLHNHSYPNWKGGVNAMYHGIEDAAVYEGRPRIYAEMEAGDTIFFHPLVIHGSGSNRTNGFRKAISCHYAAGECNYIDVRGTNQEALAQEVDKVVKRRLGDDVHLDYHAGTLFQYYQTKDIKGVLKKDEQIYHWKKSSKIAKTLAETGTEAN